MKIDKDFIKIVTEKKCGLWKDAITEYNIFYKKSAKDYLDIPKNVSILFKISTPYNNITSRNYKIMNEKLLYYKGWL